jgi:hypothetical protein
MFGIDRSAAGAGRKYRKREQQAGFHPQSCRRKAF